MAMAVAMVTDAQSHRGIPHSGDKLPEGAKAAWADDLGLPRCIADLFVAEHGGRLPVSNTELCEWANSTGRRLPSGVWQCTPTPAGAVATVPTEPGWGEALQRQVTQAHSWADANPGTASLVSLTLWLLLRPRRRRR